MGDAVSTNRRSTKNGNRRPPRAPSSMLRAALVAGSAPGRARVSFTRIWPQNVRVPVLWLKNIAGVFLIPVAWIWTVSFFGLLVRETVHHRFWSTEEFWFFGLGTVLWMLCFAGSLYSAGEPRPLRVYVFGHELTHAVWAWLCGGFVKDFTVNRDGGHILTNKANFWVTLTPYFYPVYSLALMVIFLIATAFYDFHAADWSGWLVTPLQGFVLALGGSWAFHLSFTVWMICRGQSDLRMHGNFFSIVLIYLMNVVLLSLHLAVALPGSGFRIFGAELLRHTEDFADATWSLFAEWVGRM